MDEDALRAMNAIAPAPASSTSGRPPPPRQTIELSEQTPLSGFDQKQTQIEAGAILDVGASIMKVGDQGRPRDAPSAPDSAAPAGYGAAVGWEEAKAAARDDEDDAYASALVADSADAAEAGVILGETVHSRLVGQRRQMEGAGSLLTDLRRVRTAAGAYLEDVRRRKTRWRNYLIGVAALLSAVDAGLFYGLLRGHGSFLSVT